MKKFIPAIILFIFCSSFVFAQKDASPLKAEAQKQMKAGRYGEAIDLLNRYISANPQKADGYNLRGLCNEKRSQYEQAVYDFRSARKLDPNNKEINQNLSRATDSWYKLLYNKIEGHKREIAINPNAPRNYLEIGKSYKNLGEWGAAEVWYDDYLKREEASSDEIIRYTEILAKNNHIKKGEPILKRYTEKYPEDHRLWSRYGYFLLWLGKNKMAIDAFENALALRPFFREAMDGLDLAKGKGYIYTVNDTSARHNFGMPVASGSQFVIDKYYRLLKKNPKDNKTRFNLIEELVKHQRYEEAFQQIEIISKDSSYSEKITIYRESVKVVRDSVFQIKIAEYTSKLEKNPGDKEAVMYLANYYSGMQDYDPAMEILGNYMKNVPPEKEIDVRFKYAQVAAWNYEFELAIEQLNVLLEKDPGNLDYQLLRSQIAVWTSQDLDLADSYLENILSKDGNNIQALTSLAALKIRIDEMDSARELLERARVADPESKEVEAIQIYYDARVSYLEQLQIYQILFDARELVVAKDCEGALQKYDLYFSKISGPTRLEQAEYADVNACVGNNEKALDIYEKLLQEEYDFDIAVQRGTIYLRTGDSLKALEEFQRLVQEKPDHFDARLNLAVAYEFNDEFGEAEDIYDQLLKETDDTLKISMIEQRKSWIQAASLGGAFGSFPSHIAFSPTATFYSDNQNFQFNNVGGRVEFGLTSFLAVGSSLTRTTLNNTTTKYLTSFKWQVFLRPLNKVVINGGFGVLNTQNENKRNITDVIVRYEDPDKLLLNAYYENTDARLLLYSPNLINIALDADLYRLNGNFQNKAGLKLSGQFSYIAVQDGNKGNDFMLRVGKKFYESISLGYEYIYMHYLKSSKLYYSPQYFDSHSIWAEWNAIKDDGLALNFGGKIGYVPQGDFIIREISGDISYNPVPYFFLNAHLGAGSTYRYGTSYNFFTASVSAYISFH